MKIKMHPGNPVLSERKTGFFSGENHHPAKIQLVKHAQAVHNSNEPVDTCPACQDILKKIEKARKS